MTSTISEPATGRDARAGRAPNAGRALLERRLTRDKLRVPRPNVPLLHRHRLTSLIQCATSRRVTVVCGPTGAGKTIACAHWAAGQHVAWVSLDPGDRRPARLWAHVRGALAEHPKVRHIADELPDPADDSFPLQLARVAERLPAPVTLIIDDVQELAGSESQASLDLLVRHGPPALRLLLAGRHLGGLSVARLRVGGDLAEIDSADLACTADETRDYFSMLGVELPGEQLDELLGRTQGWITGLRLAALRSGPGQTAGVPWRIAGDEPQVADYLRDEILASQPAACRDFLLRTCLVDRICGDLADILTGSDGGSAMLDRLCRENVMIGPAEPGTVDPDYAEYRYHPLLLDLLRAQLRRELPGEVRLLAKRAASWQASRGQHADALRSAVCSGDWEFAIEILAQTGPELLLPGPASAIEPVLATFPAASYTSDAAVAGALAASGLRTGDSYATQLHLDNAVTALDRCAPGQRPIVTTWLRALMVMQATAVGRQRPDTDAAVVLAHEAGATVSDAAGHQAVGLLWTALGVAALAELRVADARVALTQGCVQLSQGGRPEFSARAQAWRAIAEALYGDLLAAGDHIAGPASTGPASTEPASTDPVASRLSGLAASWLRLAKDETAIARRLLDEHDAGQQADPGNRTSSFLATMARARLALCQGDLPAARRHATRLRYESSAPGACLAALDADVALGEGDPARARLALARAQAADPACAGLLALNWARVLLAEGDCAAALARAQSCLAAEGEDFSLRDRICALVTAAIAQRKLGHPDAAADQLGYALALAEPHGEYRPFLDGGTAARSALTVLIRPTGQGAACAARILQRFETRPGRPSDTSPTVPLTGSELAVLRFLPSHLTNQEIAEALFLSINTVKTHLRSAYRKLGVTTRRQAISAAGRLGLL